MSGAIADTLWTDDTEKVALKPPRRVSGWPLMGDIVSHRAGVSEHLIQWRRSMGEGDPEPMLGSSSWSNYSGEREG